MPHLLVPQRDPQRGQTLILFALLSLMLMAGLGLVMDAGLEYAQRRNVQNAADTAALRGARLIAQRSANIATEVQAMATLNISSTVTVTCEYINNSRQTVSVNGSTACADTALPASHTVSGVKVTVSEQHETLIMKVLGIPTAGTKAVALAQVQMITEMPSLDVPFIVCGVETRTTDGGTSSILNTYDYPFDPVPPSPEPISEKRATTPTTAISSSAYSFDWNGSRNPADSNYDSSSGFVLLSSSAPEYVIYGSSVATCKTNVPGWYGLVAAQTTINTAQKVSVPSTGIHSIGYLVPGRTGTLSDGTTNSWAYPYHNLNGTKGCKSGETPNGCVMLLPVVDNEDSSGGVPNDFFFIARAWGAFWVTYDAGSDEYHARLIKNYPIHSDGSNVWTTDYYGPIKITLVAST